MDLFAQKPSGSAALLATVAFACAPAPPPRPNTDQALVSRARSVAEARLRRQTFRAWSQSVSGAPVVAADNDAAWLLAPSTLDALRRVLRAEQDPVTRRALHNLHAFLVREHLEDAVAPIDERVQAIRQESFEIDGAEIRYRDLATHLATEPDPIRRRRLAEAAGKIYTRLEPLLEERQQTLEAAARRIGYADPVTLANEIRQYDVVAAAELAEQLLVSSEALYLTTLRELAPPAVGVPAERLAVADLPRLRHISRFADRFHPDGVRRAIDRTLTGLGFRGAEVSLSVDARPPASMSTGTGRFPIAVPADVRLSIGPSGPGPDYRILMHELGHVLQYSHGETPVFELEQLGDGSLAEGFAFLIEWIADEPDWLREQLGLEEPALTRVVRLAALDRLATARRYAGRLLFEVGWLCDPGRRGQDSYGRHMSRAYGFRLQDAETERYIVDQDPFLVDADAVRGSILAAELRQQLRQRHGRRWWASEATGAALRELWAAGRQDNAPEPARRLQLGVLRPDRFVADIAAAIARPRD